MGEDNDDERYDSIRPVPRYTDGCWWDEPGAFEALRKELLDTHRRMRQLESALLKAEQTAAAKEKIYLLKKEREDIIRSQTTEIARLKQDMATLIASNQAIRQEREMLVQFKAGLNATMQKIIYGAHDIYDFYDAVQRHLGLVTPKRPVAADPATPGARKVKVAHVA